MAKDANGATYEGGTATKNPDGSYNVDTDKFTDADGNVFTHVVGGKVDASGHLTYAKSMDTPKGSGKAADVTGVSVQGGGYSIASVGSLQQGPIVITNGKNVKYENGCLTADTADSLVETDTIATKLDKVNYCDKTIDVKKADSVWASCVYMEDVENAKITAKTDVTIDADKDSEFKIKDCSTNQYDFKSLSDDSSLVISKSTTTTVLDLIDVQIELEKNGITETVESNNSAKVEVSRTDGMQHIHMEPVTLYTYDAKDATKDFSIRAWQDNHDIFLRKSDSDAFPPEVKSCKSCSIFDLPNHALEIRGIVDLNKPQIKKDGKSEGLVTFFTTGNKDAKAILTFDKDNAFINDVLILNDAPPYKTVVSNYITIEEAIQHGTSTERLLTINDKITKEKLTQSWIKSYRTAYSPSVMKVDDNTVDYQRNGVVLTVYPAGHSKIAELIKHLTSVHALLFASFAVILAGVAMSRPGKTFYRQDWTRLGHHSKLNRATNSKSAGVSSGKKSKRSSRGQLTIFMLLGVVILAVAMLLLFITVPDHIVVKSESTVQEYVNNCLKLAGEDTLKVLGLQGGHLALQTPFQTTPTTAFDYLQGVDNQLPLERIELDVGEDTKARTIKCIDNFKAFTGVTVENVGSPTVKAILGKDQTTFMMEYRFFVNKGTNRWEFKDFVATGKPVLNFLEATNATVISQIQNEERINLDSLPSATYTFFPYENALITLLEGKDYQFVFANKR